MPNHAIPASIHPKYRPDIDGLRAVAVLSVLVYHAFPKTLTGGFVGVDIFFVISGYLISTIILGNLSRGAFRLLDFYARRVRRIFPVLLVVMASCLALGWYQLLPEQYKQLGKHIASGAGFVSNLTLWNEAGYFDSSSETKPLLHLWSLGIEEQFYLVWPLLLWLALKGRVNQMFFVGVLILSTFAVNLALVSTDIAAAFYSPVSRFWELGLGSLLALFAHSPPTHWKRWRSRLENVLHQPANRASIHAEPGTLLSNFASISGLALIACALYLLNPSRSFPGGWALLPTLGAFLIIAAGPETWVNRRLLSHRVLVWIGLISYPLYLWHWPLLAYLRIINIDASEVAMRNAKVGVVFLSLLLAWGSYQLIEKPIRGRALGKLKVLLLCALMVVMATAGYQTYRGNGLGHRFPEQIQSLVTITNPYEFFRWPEEVRIGTCHSTKIGMDLNLIMKNCVDTQRPLLFLWGDSYAASLYPGLAALQTRKQFGIAQFTAGAAPPFFDATRLADNKKTLEAVNEEALAAVAKLQPDEVILTYMVTSPNAPSAKPDAVTGLMATIGKIRASSPGTHVVIIGPVPHWRGTLIQRLVQFQEKARFRQEPATYMSFGLEDGIAQWDEYLARELPHHGAAYISAYRAMCTAEGCLTRVGSKPSDLTAVDWGHLSKAGAEYLVNHIADELFSGLSGSL